MIILHKIRSLSFLLNILSLNLWFTYFAKPKVIFLWNTLIDPFIFNDFHYIGRLELGQDAVVVVTLMACYRKTGSANPYVVKLSMLDDELALTAYAQVVMASLGEFNERYVQSRQAEPQSSWLSSLTSMVGSMFVSDEAEIRIGQVKYVTIPTYIQLISL